MNQLGVFHVLQYLFYAGAQVSRPRIKRLPTFTEVRAVLNYDPITGVFRRRTLHGDRPMPVTVQSSGYQFINVTAADGMRSMYLGHRLAWLLHYGEWPVGELDHIDNNKLNNRISNLRIVTRSQNMRKAPLYNATGARGVRAVGKKFHAYIGSGSSRKWLGSFATVEEGAEAYRIAAVDRYADFANTLVVIRGSIAATITMTMIQ